MCNVILTLMVVAMILSVIIFLHYDKLASERRIENTQVFSLPEDNYQVIIYGKQYRVIYKQMGYSDIYNFPQGTELSSGKEREFIIDSINRFKEDERTNSRRKLFEGEMFMDISSEFSKWDKELSIKSLNK